MNSKILQATAVYVSCKQDGYPRTLREISAISGVSTKQIGKYDSIINQKHYDITPDMYVNRFCSKLGKSFQFTKRAQNFAKDLYVKNKSNPISISATAIYLANQSDRKTEKKILRKIQNLTGISPSTIMRSIYSLSKSCQSFDKISDFKTI